MDVLSYNSAAWDREVAQGNPWTVPATPAAIAAARAGRPVVVLTPLKPVPAEWLGPLAQSDVLCLASGGGQQGPVLAAAGARVTVLDASQAQLARDQEVAEREGLAMRLIKGDMRDLSGFAPDSFDLIVHPISNCFVEDVRPVWRECFRALRPGGRLLSGFGNPVIYTFDPDRLEAGELVCTYPLPYSDLKSLTDAERKRYLDKGWPLQFGHSLDDQIGGQIAAGFALTGFYEDKGSDPPVDRIMPAYLATRALKPA